MESERRLGLSSATALVVANMVGTGVFTTSGLLIADLGSAWLVLLAWVLGGVVALLGALCYGALAATFPNRAESTCFCRALCIRHLATWPAGFRCWWVLPSRWARWLLPSGSTCPPWAALLWPPRA